MKQDEEIHDEGENHIGSCATNPVRDDSSENEHLDTGWT
jgi:GTP cyclohydrolase I